MLVGYSERLIKWESREQPNAWTQIHELQAVESRFDKTATIAGYEITIIVKP